MTEENAFPLPDEPEGDETLDDFDSDSAEATRKRNEEIAFRHLQTHEWWQRALGDEVGRRAIWEVFGLTGYYETLFAASPNGSPDRDALMMRIGRHDVGRQLFEHLLVQAREGMLLMLDAHHPSFKKI